MKRWIILLVSLCCLQAAAQNPSGGESLTADQATRDLRILKRAFTALHPGLYRYLTPEQLDAAFAQAGAEVSQGSSRPAMYLLASRLSALIRCGHTWTNPLNQPPSLREQVFGLADKLPFRLRLIEGRFLVTASSDPQVADGEELIDVDGRSIPDIVAELLPYLRADGSNDGKRLSQISSGPNGGAMDRLFPLLHPPIRGRYQLTLRGPRGLHEIGATAVTESARETLLASTGHSPVSEQWSFSIDGDVAVLTIPTFSFWNGGFDWKGALQRIFSALDAHGTRHLIIDLRHNEGGDSAVGEALLSYLLRAPYSAPRGHAEVAYERAPYNLVKFLDTWDFDFFDHTGKVEKTGGRNLLLNGESAKESVVMPQARPYRGEVIALVGPEMSSAGFLIARDLKQSSAAELIGEPVGGNLRGMNGGQLAWITLPNSGVTVDIPLVAWMPDTTQPDATVMPDVEIRPRFSDAQAGVDSIMQAALRRLR